MLRCWPLCSPVWWASCLGFCPHAERHASIRWMRFVMSKTCVLSEASGPKPRPPKAARWFGVLGAGLLTLLFQGYAHAQAARTLTQEQQVVEALLQRHPQLRVALLTQAQSNA